MSKVAPEIIGEKCSFCGACISVCPLKCLEVGDDYPIVNSEKCIECGLCSRVCPIININFFKEEIPVKEYYTARTLLPEVAERAQDGGIVTTILLSLLEDNYINSAVVAAVSSAEHLKPIPKVIRSKEELLHSAGSKYSSSPNLAELSKITMKDSVAVVGVPCQMRALTLIEKIGLKKIAKPLKVKIGLFCMENYRYKDYIEGVLKSLMNVNPRDVVKANIKAGKFILYLRDGSKVKKSIHELKPYVRLSCNLCPDLTAEYADISIGGIGSERGWSTVLIRTERGYEAFKRALDKGYIEAKELPEKGIKLINKLANMKRSNALKKLSGK